MIEQIYRKAALKIVRDLGEDVFPEPESNAEVTTATTTTSTDSQDTQKTVESQEPLPNAPLVESTSKPETRESPEDKDKEHEKEKEKEQKVCRKKERKGRFHSMKYDLEVSTWFPGIYAAPLRCTTIPVHRFQTRRRDEPV